jgi:molybdate transport system ATP-binding protein
MSVLQFDCRFTHPTGFVLDRSFEAADGITALVGPSGSGKSTTLHLIAGILRPSSGRIILKGQALFDSSQKTNIPPYQRQIGVVFQDYQLFPHLTVDANLRFGFRRSPRRVIDINHVIEVLELGPFLTRYPATLSGGQRQRVALGRAIAIQPSLLLLDEPVSALDNELKSSIVAYLLGALTEFPIPTILVTHDLAIVERIAAAVIRY